MFSFPLGSGTWRSLEIELSQVPYLLERLDLASKIHKSKKEAQAKSWGSITQKYREARLVGAGLTALVYPTWYCWCQKFFTVFCCFCNLSTPNFPSCYFSFSFSFIILCAHLALSLKSSSSKDLFVRNPEGPHPSVGKTVGIQRQGTWCSVVDHSCPFLFVL